MTATLEHPNTRAAWLLERRSYLGATDVAAILGTHPYTSALLVYQEKLGLSDPQPETAAMRRGTKMEPYVAAFYEEEQNVTLEKSPTYRHPTKSYIAANPDYAAYRKDAPRGGIDHLVELKTHNVFMAQNYGDPGTDQIPEHELIQCQYQMHVTGVRKCVLYVMFGLDDLRAFPVEYDADLGQMLEEAADRFWQDHILAEVPPEFTGHQSEAEWLKRRYPSDSGEFIYADQVTDALCSSLKIARQQREEAEAREEAIEIQVKAFMGPASILSSSVGQFTWKQAKDSEVIDWKAIAAELGAPVSLIQKYTAIKAGSRRFLTPFRKGK